MSCPLCDLEDGQKLWTDGNFFCTLCKATNHPMIVLREHRTEPTDSEAVELSILMQKYYPNLISAGQVVRGVSGHFRECLVEPVRRDKNNGW